MFDFRRVSLPSYSPFEDRINSLSHAVGVPFAVLAAILLYARLGAQASAGKKTAVAVYALSMLIVFFGSAYYHGLKPSYKKQVARVLDHSNIFLMISGSTTAVCVLVLQELHPLMSRVLIAVLWCASAVGIFLNFMDLDKLKWIQLTMYVILGWVAVIPVAAIYKSVDFGKGFALTALSGGVSFTLGAVLYVIGKKRKYFHAVFHVFVLMGAVLVFLAVYNAVGGN